MAEITREDVIEYVKSMTVLELSELSKELEDVFGVSAQMAMPAAMAGAAAPEAAPVEEQTEFTVMLTDPGENRVKTIKAVREVTSLGLREAKALVDEAPKPIKDGIPKEEAESIKEKFVEVGATVEIK